jgi:metallophosphoesterase (TIGR00282 family)
MRILFIGDIVAKPGRTAVKEVLPKLRNEEKIDFVVANAENLAHGRGATLDTIREMQQYGVDYFTGGDHLFWHKDFEDEMENLPVIRPANFPDPTPGEGYALVEHTNGEKILLINVMGRTGLGGLNVLLEDPFRTTDHILEKFRDEKIDHILIDFHGDTTSEKAAFGFYFDGRVTATLGTHTHVPTCDERILPKGTMFISDIGMTGSIDSILGVKTEIIINQFLSARHQKFEWEDTGQKAFRSVILDTKSSTIARKDFSNF